MKTFEAHLIRAEAAATCFRLFLCPGDAHASITGAGPGISMAAGLAALMEWVEDGSAPELVIGTRMDAATRRISMSRPICAYPQIARYLGGDPSDAASFAEPRCIDTAR